MFLNRKGLKYEALVIDYLIWGPCFLQECFQTPELFQHDTSVQILCVSCPLGNHECCALSISHYSCHSQVKVKVTGSYPYSYVMVPLCSLVPYTASRNLSHCPVTAIFLSTSLCPVNLDILNSILLLSLPFLCLWKPHCSSSHSHWYCLSSVQRLPPSLKKKKPIDQHREGCSKRTHQVLISSPSLPGYTAQRVWICFQESLPLPEEGSSNTSQTQGDS